MGSSNPKRAYLPIPTVLTPDEFVCFEIRIPHDSEHLAAFWGALDALAQRYSWGTPLTDDSEVLAAYWRDLIISNRECYEEAIFMANGGCGCCPDEVFRYTADGVRQVSRDGGETWTDDPSDPRVSGSIVPPPPWLLLPGGHECEGAITGRLNMKALSDEIFTTGAEVGLTGLAEIIALVLCSFTGGIVCAVIQLITVIVVTAINIGLDIIQAALTDEVYDTFQCILFCNIEPNATFTEAGWSGVKNDITDQLSGDAEFWLWNMVNIMGAQGLTNMCQLSLAVSGDCDDCVCEPCENTFAIVGTETDHPSEFVWSFDSADDGFGQQVVIIQFGSGGLSECCCLVSVDIVGFAPFEFYRLCGDPDQLAGNPGGASIWEYRRGTGVGGAAFGMTVTVETCP